MLVFQYYMIPDVPDVGIGNYSVLWKEVNTDLLGTFRVVKGIDFLLHNPSQNRYKICNISALYNLPNRQTCNISVFYFLPNRQICNISVFYFLPNRQICNIFVLIFSTTDKLAIFLSFIFSPTDKFAKYFRLLSSPRHTLA